MLDMSNFEIENLKRWFLLEKRDLPWRQNPSPYAVWVSEVMLQQTQVAVVIPYFERWMQQFPTVQHLAAASLDEVIKAWEGLGYYSRARNLHAGAKQVVENFSGILPCEEEKLQAIKGLGPYTIGAIRAFAFRQKAAAVDGNVLRVLSRHDLVTDDIAKAKTVQNMRARAQQMLPSEEPWIISEALIELGATICGRRPRCQDCPLQKSCQAYRRGMVDSLPIKSKKQKLTPLYRAVAVIMREGRCLIRRVNSGEMMSDLHEFPYFETDSTGFTAEQLKDKIHQHWLLPVAFQSSLELVRHGFTHYNVRLTPVLFTCSQELEVAGYRWVSFVQFDQLAFSSGHRRIYQALRSRIL